MKVRTRGVRAPQVWEHETTCSGCGSGVTVEASDLDTSTGHVVRVPDGEPSVVYNVKARCAVCGEAIAVPEVPSEVFRGLRAR